VAADPTPADRETAARIARSIRQELRAGALHYGGDPEGLESTVRDAIVQALATVRAEAEQGRERMESLIIAARLVEEATTAMLIAFRDNDFAKINTAAVVARLITLRGELASVAKDDAIRRGEAGSGT
jgi:hypothetical protein